MDLCKIRIQNYKSLKDISFTPYGFSSLIGPNASGKSNFADSFSFLALTFKHGLEYAVALKGGYENIAYRKQRRSKSPIIFMLELNSNPIEAKKIIINIPDRKRHHIEPTTYFKFIHEYSFKAHDTGIKSDFYIISEVFRIYICNRNSETMTTAIDVTRNSKGNINSHIHDNTILTEYLKLRMGMQQSQRDEIAISPQDLMISSYSIRSILFRTFSSHLANMAIFRFSPDLSRTPGVPTPNPTLSVNGENLPAVVDWLIRHQPKEWRDILSSMKDIVPSIEDIYVQYLHTKTLGLFFKEENIGRAWTSVDVSDGTIQTLGMLVAAVDPRNTLLFIEEPENSIHPWIIRVLVERLRKVSGHKNVIITTHSPVLIDLLLPSEAWIVYKRDGATNLMKLIEIDPDIETSWTSGKYKLSDYLDSGLIHQAIPGGI